MPRSWQKVVSRPVKPSTLTFGKSRQTSLSMSMRSSAENSRLFDLFTPTATTTSSKRKDALDTMSMCPFVTGSNDPGHTALRTAYSSAGTSFWAA